MEDTVRRYISYDEDGEIKLALKTTLIGGYDRDETCEMVRNLSEYYKERIMSLMDAVAEKDEEIHLLRRSVDSAKHALG